MNIQAKEGFRNNRANTLRVHTLDLQKLKTMVSSAWKDFVMNKILESQMKKKCLFGLTIFSVLVMKDILKTVHKVSQSAVAG